MAEEEIIENQDTRTDDGGGEGPEEFDYKKGYSELETKLGEQGRELGESRKMNELLMGKLEGQGQPKDEPQGDEPKTDYDKEISSLAQKVREGELDIDEALVRTSALTAEMASAKTMEQIAANTQQQTFAESQSQFLKNNPDYTDLKKSGALEDIKKTLPGLHDDFSAYHAYKAHQNAQAIEAARLEGIEAGKAEAAKIAEGDKNTGKVIAKPGSGAEKNIGDGSKGGKLSKTEMRQSMLQAVHNHRKAAG